MFFSTTHHATVRLQLRLPFQVAQCESDVRLRQRGHWDSSKVCAETEIKVRLLEKKLKSSINKSKTYYDLRSQMNHYVEVRVGKQYFLGGALFVFFQPFVLDLLQQRIRWSIECAQTQEWRLAETTAVNREKSVGVYVASVKLLLLN